MSIHSVTQPIIKPITQRIPHLFRYPFGLDYINDYIDLADPGGTMGVDNDKLTLTAHDTGDTAYHISDFGFPRFNDGFESVTKINFSAVTNDANPLGFSGLSTMSNSILQVIIGGGNIITPYVKTATAQLSVGLAESDGGAPFLSDSINLSKSTDYWIKFQINTGETTAYVAVYSDASLQTEVDNKSLVLQAMPDYRYLVGLTSFGDGTVKEFTGTVEMLDYCFDFEPI